MPRGRIQVLVLEDDEVSAMAARLMLDKLGCRVDVAANGVEAIEHFGRSEYDLIFMDWRMPLMDGVAPLRNVEWPIAVTVGKCS